MDQGKIAELDTPQALYKNGGIFRSMCDKGGIREVDIEERNEEVRRAAGEGGGVTTPMGKD